MKSPSRWLITICVVAFLVGVTPPASSGQNLGSVVSITDVLGKTLGVSGDQASGGVGSILSLAQNKLSASDYSKVADAVPGADKYVQKAKDLGAVPAEGIKEKSGLDAAYEKLGINPDVAKKFTPAVVDFVGKAGGSEVGSLLGSVLK
ncbi:MAG TPA: DUF2780 domain-containing protein [Thermoanaerobaculia bacterium]